MNTPKNEDKLHLAVGIFVIVVLLFLAAVLLFNIIPLLPSANPDVQAAIITGVLLFVGTMTVKHFENRRSIEAQFREAKVQMFDDFLEIFDGFSQPGHDFNAAASELKKWRRKLLLRGGPNVIKASFRLLAFHQIELNTVEDMAKSVERIGSLILAMRRDLGISNSGIAEGVSGKVNQATIVGVRHILRNADMFLECLENDPNMSMKDFGEKEKVIDRARGIS